MSLPSRERELKLVRHKKPRIQLLSLPSRERELKHFYQKAQEAEQAVAPFAGARVETKNINYKPSLGLGRSLRGSAS